MTAILKALESGSQPYVVLRSLNIGNLDELLRVMLLRGEIVKVVVDGRYRYGLPKAPAVDEPDESYRQFRAEQHREWGQKNKEKISARKRGQYQLKKRKGQERVI